MGEMISFGGYDEQYDDGNYLPKEKELEQKLMFSQVELDKLRAETRIKFMKYEQDINRLIHEVKLTQQERDHARYELSNVIKFLQANATMNDYPSINSANDQFIMNNNRIVPKLDEASLIIETIAERRGLPQRGRLFKAVHETGPLLQTLLVAGPVPTWRNPPQPFQRSPGARMWSSTYGYSPSGKNQKMW